MEEQPSEAHVRQPFRWAAEVGATLPGFTLEWYPAYQLCDLWQVTYPLCLRFLICEMLLWNSAIVNYMQTVVFALCLVHAKA